MLAKILFLNELYQKILDLPGIIVQFGVWWGSDLALFESLRSVYEPYNSARKIVGFDTFEGYTSFSEKDGPSAESATAGYEVTKRYEDYLSGLLGAHEIDNVLSHIKKYGLVKGDVVNTLSRYLAENPQTIISLAYLDLALYEPTRKCLEAIQPHLVQGSIIALDELNSKDLPGETIALKDTLGLMKYRILKSNYLPDRSYLIVS